MKNGITISLTILLILVTSCKSKQIISGNKVDDKPIAELIEKIKAAEPEFKTANVSKMNLSLKLNERHYNVGASCKIIFDSAIHISIQPILGIELFKAQIYKDSIHIFDKMNRRYYALDFQYFERKFGVNIDYYSLQALLSNKLFKLENNYANFSDCSVGKSTVGKQTIEYESSKIKQIITISEIDRIEQVDILSKNNGAFFKTLYSEFNDFESVNFPQKINLTISNQKNNFKCEFIISKVIFNTEIVLTSTEPERYTKADIDQILKK